MSKNNKTKQNETSEAIRFVQYLRRLNPDAKLRDVLDEFLHDIYETFPEQQAQFETEQADKQSAYEKAIAERDAENVSKNRAIQIEREKKLL